MNGEKDLTVKDIYGKPLRRGTKVAFNWSGAVAIGHIESIKPAKRYGESKDLNDEPYVTFQIRHQKGALSVIRNRLSVTNIE